MDAPKNIVYLTANPNNMGDVLALYGTRMLLGLYSPKVYFVDDYYLATTLDYLSTLTDKDVIILAGGGLLSPYFSNLWRFLNKTPAKLIIFGCGSSSVDTGTDVQILRGGKPTWVMLRDFYSQTRLYDSDLPIFMDNVVGCPSMTYLTDWYAKHKPSRITEPYTLVSMRQEAVWDHENKTKLRTCSVDYIISSILKDELGKQPRLVEHIDHEATTAVHDTTYNIFLHDVLLTYLHAELVVTSRMHGFIIASCLRRPVIALDFDNKIRSYAERAGLLNCVCSHPEDLKKYLDATYPREGIDTIIRHLSAKADRALEFMGMLTSYTTRPLTGATDITKYVF